MNGPRGDAARWAPAGVAHGMGKKGECVVHGRRRPRVMFKSP